MRTRKHLLSLCAAACLLLAGPTGCQNYEIPAADSGLSYPAGEIAPGEGPYTSDAPSIRCAGTPEFAISAVTCNGTAVDSSIARIDPATGVITLTPPSDASAVGTYLVSVRVTLGRTTTEYKGAARVAVKGLVFEQSEAVAARGSRLVIPIRETCLVEQQGTVYALEVPEGAEWTGIGVDPETGTVTVEPEAEAGIYPISIRATNRTNPEGMLFAEVLTITVESKPYGLTYTPASVTLIPLEGHLSPRPTVHAASVADGTEVSYALLDDFDGAFAIDPRTGEISLAENTPLVTQTAKSFPLQVRVSNDRGTASFPEAYIVTVDPAKKAEPITKIAYPDKLPVVLAPGQAWTSERPTVEGSTVGIVWSLAAGAPQGVAIDPATGVVTLAQGHRMPLKTADNSLTVEVRNQGMTEPCTAQLDFSIDPVLWQVKITANTSANAMTHSGIANMDRISFMGKMFQSNASSVQVKLGWGKSSAGAFIDVIGINDATDNKNQNNDWLVSEQIDIASYCPNPTVRFTMAFNYGTAAQNLLGLYIVEVDGQNAYTYDAATDQEQDGTLDSTPCDLPWVALADAEPIVPTTAAGYGNEAQYAFPIPERYKGKSIRIALRYWNPSASTNNNRTYRIKNDLRVEASDETAATDL